MSQYLQKKQGFFALRYAAPDLTQWDLPAKNSRELRNSAGNQSLRRT
jgi:hypothetical protein